MPEIIFPSKWLKADMNVKERDIITFLNTGEFRQKAGTMGVQGPSKSHRR